MWCVWLAGAGVTVWGRWVLVCVITWRRACLGSRLCRALPELVSEVAVLH